MYQPKMNIETTKVCLTPMDTGHLLIMWEDGRLSKKATIAVFQRIIDDGSTHSMPGMYGRYAADLIDEGLCTPPAMPFVTFRQLLAVYAEGIAE